MDSDRLWTRNFLMICLSSFFMFLNFYMLATTLPLFVADKLHGANSEIGLVITVYVIAAVMLRPMAGQWADRFGNKKMTLISGALFLAFSSFYFGTYTLWALLGLRVLHGASYGMNSTAMTAGAADLIPEQRKGEGVGYYSMFMSVSMVLGPFAGLMLVNHGSYTLLFTVCASSSLLSFLLSAAVKMKPARSLKADQAGKPSKAQSIETQKRQSAETQPVELQSAEAPKRQSAGASLASEEALTAKKGFSLEKIVETKALPVSIAGFILAFSYSSLTSFMSVYAKEIHLTQTASYFFICFALMIVLPRPIIGRVFDRYGEHFLAYPGVALFIAGMLLLSQAHTGTMLLVSGAVIGLGHGALIPCFQTLALQSTEPHRSGAATATFFLLFDLGYGIGSYVLGLIAAAAGYQGMYAIAGGLVILTGIVYYLLHHRVKQKNALSA